MSVVHFKGLSLHVVFMLIPMLHNVGRETHGQILKLLASLVESGSMTPVLDKQVFSWQEVGLAHARLASAEALGKVVIDISSD